MPLLIHIGAVLLIIATLYCDLSRKFRDTFAVTVFRHGLIIGALYLAFHADDLVAQSQFISVLVIACLWALAIRGLYLIAKVRRFPEVY